MAIMDEVLASIVAGLADDLAAAGLTRQRGGLARGIAWAEASGRSDDGSWLELRLHHRPMENRLQAGLLEYQRLSRGGRTVPIGECSFTYYNSPDEVTQDVADAVLGWLHALSPTTATR